MALHLEPLADRASVPLDYLALGHVTLDRQPDGGVLPGGTVLFSTLQAARLGLRAGTITAGNVPALLEPLAPYIDEIEVDLHTTAETTTFTNVGVGSARQQTLSGWARPLALAELTIDARIVHLGPVAQELPLDALPVFPEGALVGVTPQGWMRRWDSSGRVSEHPLALSADLIARLDALVLSEREALLAGEVLAALRAAGGLVAITCDAEGCLLHIGPETIPVPANEHPLVDDTGAGDVFAAAFFVALAEGQSPVEAARFANAAAGLSIGGRGAGAIATREAIERVLRRSGG